MDKMDIRCKVCHHKKSDHMYDFHGNNSTEPQYCYHLSNPYWSYDDPDICLCDNYIPEDK